MTRVLCVVGTRPEAIKMAPVIRALAAQPERCRVLTCSTGQHSELLDSALELFGIQPDFELKVMRPSQTLAALTARLFAGLDRVLAQTRADWVLAQGDTTTAFVAAVSAFYRGSRFGHVEAGLRTGDKRRPFPEELNRRLAGVAADLHCAPTERARLALLREGVPDSDIVVTGNPVVDAVREVARWPYDWSSGPLARLPRQRHWVVVTIHRRESFGVPLLDLCRALRRLAACRDDIQLVWPVHPNPNVREPVSEILSNLENVSLIDPLDYASMVHLLKRSSLVLTDSGGLQEEAPSLGVPVLVLRDVTERPEGLSTGLVELVGTQPSHVIAAATRWLDASRVASPEPLDSPYGDGRSSERIASAVLARSSSTPSRRKAVGLPIP